MSDTTSATRTITKKHPKPVWFSELFSNKPNWKTQLERSGLPIEVRELIRSVVVNSRLMRFEKADVAADLIGHFVDGHQRGIAYSAIVEEFGNPTLAATLIRNSKVRNRPMMYKILRGMGIGASVLGLSYLVLLAFFYLGKPNPTTDFLVQWNEPSENTLESERAWPVYRPLWGKHNFCEGGGNNFQELYVDDDDDPSSAKRMVQPFDDQWTEAIAKLDASQDLLESFRIGAKLPALGLTLQTDARIYSDADFAVLFPHQTKEEWDPNEVFGNIATEPDSQVGELLNGSLIGIMLPHIQSFRKAARILHVDTRRAVTESDSDRALENIETTWGLAHQASEANCLVGALVGFAVAEIGNHQLEEVLVENVDFFSDEQLERLQVAAERISPRTWIKYGGERAMVKDIIQRVYTDDGNGDGRMTPQGVKLLSSWNRLFVQVAGVGAGTTGKTVGFGSSAQDIYETIMRKATPALAPASLLVCASRSEVTETCDLVYDQFEVNKMLPFWSQNEVMVEGISLEDFLTNNQTKHSLLNATLPAHEQVQIAMFRTIGRTEGVITAIAIHRYFKKYDRWPETFEEVSPEFVIEFPIDQVDGSLLKFKYDDDSLLVYSVGRDHDDDGGAEHGSIVNGTKEIEDRGSFLFGESGVPSTRHDGDWIIWPQYTK